MSTHDYVIANQTGANTRSDLNNAFSAIVSNNSSASEPATMYAYQWWADTANDLLKQRNAANSAWISILTLSTGAVTSGGDPTMGGDLTGTASNAQIAANAVGLAEMAGGTDGNLITYDASGDPAYVTTGTSGQVLTSGGTGVAPTFQAAAGGGKVLQVVQGYTSTTAGTTGTTYVDSNLTATITPTLATSKVLVVVHQSACYTNVIGDAIHLNLMKDTTQLVEWCKYYGQTSTQINTTNSLSYLDSPSTTSATTYKTQLKKSIGGGAGGAQANSTYSTITLMEIGV